MAQTLRLTPLEVIQTMLDAAYGANKARATTKGFILYTFPETHHGCNEMEVGSWSLDNKKGVRLYVRLTYEEAFQFLKDGAKPATFDPIILEFQNILGDLKIG
jgi:hypothetical protein